MSQQSFSRFWRAPLVQRLPFPYLVVVPVLLAVATVVVLFVHSDVNAALLWSQCHARSRLPGLSRIPGVGTPLCYLVSFFGAALDSLRGAAVMAAVLAFVGGLLTVSAVEAARVCNGPNVLIAFPTGPWLVFDLVGGAVVWELVIIPAFLHRARSLFVARKGQRHEAAPADGEAGDASVDVAPEHSRHLPNNEVLAIPLSIAVGYLVPSIVMLATNSPAAIGVWLFFPVYVSLLRQAFRSLIPRIKRAAPELVHLGEHWHSFAVVYALPIVASILAHIFLLWTLSRPDDRQEMSRSTGVFIEVDIQFVFWTVLYWMLVEVGWRVPLTTLLASIVVGPGAGTCLGWVYREKLIHDHYYDEEGEVADQDAEAGHGADEETPLLR